MIRSLARLAFGLTVALCAASQLPLRAAAAGAYVSTSVYLHAQCVGNPLNGPTISPSAVGECAPDPFGAGSTQWFVAADGHSIDMYTFADDKCTNWLSADHFEAGPVSCVPYYDAEAGFVLYKRVQLTAPIPAGSAAPPFNWPPRDALEFIRCTDTSCSQQCTSFHAERLGVCNALGNAVGTIMKTCTRPTQYGVAKQMYTELSYGTSKCNSRPLQADLWPADGTRDNRFATCNRVAPRTYAVCSSDLSAAASTPYPLDLEVAYVQYDWSNSCGVQDAMPLTQLSLYANATCAFGEYYAAYADGLVELDYTFADPTHCRPMPTKPTIVGKVDQCVLNSQDDSSHMWTSVLSPYAQSMAFACAIGWDQTPFCGRQPQRRIKQRLSKW